MSTRTAQAGIVLTAATLSAMAVTGPAAAAAKSSHSDYLSCGQVVSTSVSLATDVGPCAHNGIVVGADHITVDLNGHHVFGTPQSGDGAGVLVSQHSGVHVQGGTVSDFDGGVVIEGGGGNKVF